MQKPPWFSRGQRGVPDPIDENKARQQLVLVYNEAGLFHLATQSEERDLAEARSVQTRWHVTVLGATLRSATQFPHLFDPAELAILQRLYKEDAPMRDLEDAHETARKYYAHTRILRREAIWMTSERLIEPLRRLVEEGLKSGNPNPEALAAWSSIDSARKQAIEETEDKKEKVQRAFDKGAQTEKDKADKLQEQVELLSAKLAQSQAQVQDLLRDKSLDTARPDPSRRQSPR